MVDLLIYIASSVVVGVALVPVLSWLMRVGV